MFKKCGYCGTVNYFNKTGYCKNCDRRLADKNQHTKGKKDNLMFDVLDEIVLETPVDFETTVKCLIDQSGGCRETLSDGNGLQFFCEKDGDFWVRPVGRGYPGFVDGKVYADNGKTKVVIQLKKDRSKKRTIISIILIPYILIAISFIVLLIRKINFTVTTIDVIAAVFLLFALVSNLTDLNKKSQNITADLQIMKGEVIKRIRAIERWND